ncbi:hypothetical protein [Vibrio marisflavi]|uniref:Uncharacterized protein n=1 Tax=Vibrio marisflavi CECT 7928 TaxID=634439 RepID=A0ABN8E9B1_9VIBR|nr:hypothetical protein [Vibrio marisflavi]CAH0542971.1 hypothetical protein VMF7928_04339 [Vibrio marisflavi CECT 7928]
MTDEIITAIGNRLLEKLADDFNLYDFFSIDDNGAQQAFSNAVYFATRHLMSKSTLDVFPFSYSDIFNALSWHFLE